MAIPAGFMRRIHGSNNYDNGGEIVILLTNY